MKSMKKLVLVGLVLLASVMGLVLMGCDTPLEPVDNVNTTTTPESKGQPETPKFTVTFDKNAENATGEMASQTFTQGEKKELPANAFVRPTWTFSGWSTNKEATTPEYGNKAQFSATKDTTLYAVWTDNGTVAPVTFTTQDGTKFFYDETVTVTLATNTEGATIEYKLDDGQWQDYSSPIEILSQNTITAKATKEGLKPSEETSATYTVRKLTSITITPPTRTVYSVGDEFAPTGMVVTAIYDDGETRMVEGKISSDTSTLTGEIGINKPVTVSYAEGDMPTDATFTVDVASYQFTETVQAYEYPDGQTGTASATSIPKVDNPVYKKFGDWPQTIKGKDIEIGSNTLTRGSLDFYVGSDGNYYVKAAEDACNKNYKYSDGTKVGQGGTSEKWFKVEPIVWRVLTDDYCVPGENGELQSTGNDLLLAENLLTGGIPYYVYVSSRTISDATVYTNNYKYSTIRAWLNGRYESDDSQANKYVGKGFLQTAFTQSARDLIELTTVDNSAESTTDATGTLDEATDFACANTTDKIFLLSEKEATTTSYGFAGFESGAGNTRIRVTTDYAKATGAYQSSTEGYGGWWWLRSPHCDDEDIACVIRNNGDADYHHYVFITNGGVVPALCVQLQ